MTFFRRLIKRLREFLYMPFDMVQALLQQATAQGSRSTVLRPLGWLASICAATVVGLAEFKAPTWLLVLFAIFSAATVSLYLGAFVYCLLTDKEALRTEKYSIQKLAIERGFRGDSITGIVADNEPTHRLLPQSGDTAKVETK